MSERKPWTKEQDNLLKHLIQENEAKNVDKLKWGDIAQLLNEHGNQRTGKQCRQRWHNQLKPGIDNDRDWSLKEQQILFRVQEELGNKWAQIAKQLPGRTDNNIKNYFYSTLRKALRKVNTYVQMHKKQSHYRNVKEFKQQTLSKILSVAEKKYENKINLRSERVETDAQSMFVYISEIKRLLVQIQRDEDIVPSSERNETLEETVELILDFNRNCKRRKGKKKDSESGGESSQEEQPVQDFVKTRNTEKESRKKKSKNTNVDVQVEEIEIFEKPIEKKSSYMDNSRNLSDSRALKKGSSSSQMQKSSSNLYGSSSFKEYHGGSGEGSQNYNPPLFQSRYFMGGDRETNFLSRIPHFQKKQTNKSNVVFDFWKQQPSNLPPINMVQWSQNIGRPDENPLRMSLTLDNSCLFTRRASSRLQKRNSDRM